VAPGATAATAAVAHLATVDGRLVVAIDDAVPPADVAAARFALEHRAAFRRTEQSSAKDAAAKEHKHGSTEHDAAAFCQTPVYARIAALVALCFPGQGFLPNRVHPRAHP
jgi:hypothetical protein